MLLGLSLKHRHFPCPQEAEHSAKSVPISVYENSVLVNRQFVAARKHGGQGGVFDLAQSCLACRDQVRPTNVQVNDVTHINVHIFNFFFVLLPPLLISFQFFVLVLPFLCELRFLDIDDLPFALQLTSLRPEQILEAEHELLKQGVHWDSFPRLKVLDHVSLVFRRHQRWAQVV